MGHRWLMHTCLIGLLSGLAGTAGADERFQWKGVVDGVDEILIQGRDVRVNHLEAKPIQRQDHRFTAPLPSRDVEVELREIKGRGRVRLMEQPSSRNDYTAVIRIEDDSGGDDEYEFELVWDDDWDDWGDEDENDDWRRSGEQETGFRWKGRVDIGARIEIQGREYELKDMGGRGTVEFEARFDAELPRSDVALSLRKLDGRGDVELLQTPSASNDYTAVVQIEDDKSGADNYEFELRWRRE